MKGQEPSVPIKKKPTFKKSPLINMDQVMLIKILVVAKYELFVRIGMSPMR